MDEIREELAGDRALDAAYRQELARTVSTLARTAAATGAHLEARFMPRPRRAAVRGE